MSLNPFELSELETRESWQRFAIVAGWIFLFVLIVATGAHAITLVVTHSRTGSGLLYAIRIGSPVLTEIFAALTAIGFAVHAWRSSQKLIGLGIEVTWLLFAALNLTTSFTVEAGNPLPDALAVWLNYGLPISALITGSAFYAMYRMDPIHRRIAELKAAQEKDTMDNFAARRAVRTSPQMQAVRTHRAWLEEIKALEGENYTPEEIAFMMSGIPELEELLHNSQRQTTDRKPLHLPSGRGIPPQSYEYDLVDADAHPTTPPPPLGEAEKAAGYIWMWAQTPGNGWRWTLALPSPEMRNTTTKLDDKQTTSTPEIRHTHTEYGTHTNGTGQSENLT